MGKLLKKEIGITLIALVITIVVLIILAGVVIYLSLGNNGILERAYKTRKEEQEQATVEKMQLILAEYTVKKHTESKMLEEYLNEQKNLKNVTNNDNGTFTVELDEYKLTIKEDDLSIKVDEVYKNNIIITVIEKTMNSVIISAQNTKDTEEEIVCTIKEKNIENTLKEGTKIEGTSNFSFENLEKGKNYIINAKSKNSEEERKLEIHIPNIINASSSDYDKDGGYSSFIDCINDENKFWGPPRHGQTPVNTMYLEIELDKKEYLKNFKCKRKCRSK